MGEIEHRDRDASDIIEGEIGHARLKAPAEGDDTGADLDKLPVHAPEADGPTADDAPGELPR